MIIPRISLVYHLLSLADTRPYTVAAEPDDNQRYLNRKEIPNQTADGADWIIVFIHFYGKIQPMSYLGRSPIFWFVILLLFIAMVTFLGPEERSLGANVRIVYLHGAWVLAAEAAFIAAAIVGLTGLLIRRLTFHRWSGAFGRTGIFFWVTYLPLSLWAMESNWNGLFLSEPRFRPALVFAVTGLLLQVGLWLINTPWLTSAANILFIVVLRFVFSQAKYIMHPPPSPIFSSGLWYIIAFFIVLNLLTCLAAYAMTRSWLALNFRTYNL